MNWFKSYFFIYSNTRMSIPLFGLFGWFFVKKQISSFISHICIACISTKIMPQICNEIIPDLNVKTKPMTRPFRLMMFEWKIGSVISWLMVLLDSRYRKPLCLQRFPCVGISQTSEVQLLISLISYPWREKYHCSVTRYNMSIIMYKYYIYFKLTLLAIYRKKNKSPHNFEWMRQIASLISLVFISVRTRFVLKKISKSPYSIQC